MLAPWVVTKLSLRGSFIEICGLHMPFQKDKVMVHKTSDRFRERKVYFVSLMWEEQLFRYFVNWLYVGCDPAVLENVRELAWQRWVSNSKFVVPLPIFPRCLTSPEAVPLLFVVFLLIEMFLLCLILVKEHGKAICMSLQVITNLTCLSF